MSNALQVDWNKVEFDNVDNEELMIIFAKVSTLMRKRLALSSVKKEIVEQQECADAKEEGVEDEDEKGAKIKIQTPRFLDMQPTDAGRAAEVFIAKELCLHSSNCVALHGLLQRRFNDISPFENHMNKHINNSTRRLCTYKNVEDWLSNFIEAKDSSVIALPPNEAGPDICYWLNKNIIVFVGVKTSCSGEGVANYILGRNAATTNIYNMLQNKRNPDKELVWRFRLTRALTNDKHPFTIIRVHIALPYTPPKRNIVRHFDTTKKMQETDSSTHNTSYSVDLDQTCLHEWIPKETINELCTKFRLKI